MHVTRQLYDPSCKSQSSPHFHIQTDVILMGKKNTNSRCHNLKRQIAHTKRKSKGHQHAKLDIQGPTILIACHLLTISRTHPACKTTEGAKSLKHIGNNNNEQLQITE